MTPTKYLLEKWRTISERRPALAGILFALVMAILGGGFYWMANGQAAKSLAPLVGSSSSTSSTPLAASSSPLLAGTSPTVLTGTSSAALAGTSPTVLTAPGSATTAAPAVSKGALVVAELFTSEGCSSCPPADDLLSVLVQKEPVPGVTVIGLSEHVEYWNDDGWTDPFSSSTYGRRQNDYRVKAFPGAGLYTPQIIVDGRLARVGNDVPGVYGALLVAAKSPKAAVDLSAAPVAGGGGLQVHVSLQIPPDVTLGGTADVVLAVTEDHLQSDVSRGENHGQHLRHTAVVRTLQVAGTVAPQTAPQTRTWSGSATIPVMPDWKLGDLRVVGFLQEQQSRRILGAGWVNVAPSSASSVTQTSAANHPALH